MHRELLRVAAWCPILRHYSTLRPPHTTTCCGHAPLLGTARVHCSSVGRGERRRGWGKGGREPPWSRVWLPAAARCRPRTAHRAAAPRHYQGGGSTGHKRGNFTSLRLVFVSTSLVHSECILYDNKIFQISNRGRIKFLRPSPFPNSIRRNGLRASVFLCIMFRRFYIVFL